MIIYSNKEGTCSQIKSVNSSPVHLTSEFLVLGSQSLEFTAVRFMSSPVDLVVEYYINDNRNYYISKCNYCPPKENYCAAHYLKDCSICKYSGSGTLYKCGSCGTYLGYDKDNCPKCGSNPNKKPAVPWYPDGS